MDTRAGHTGYKLSILAPDRLQAACEGWQAPYLTIRALDVLGAVEHMDGPQGLGLCERVVDLWRGQGPRELQVPCLVRGWMVAGQACVRAPIHQRSDATASLRGSLTTKVLAAWCICQLAQGDTWLCRGTRTACSYPHPFIPQCGCPALGHTLPTHTAHCTVSRSMRSS